MQNSQDLGSLFSLKEKLVILTGAAGFFGQYFLKALLDHEANMVVAIDVDEERMEQMKGSFDPDRVLFKRLDQYDQHTSRQFFEEISEKLLTGPTVLINNSFDFSKETGFNSVYGRLSTAPVDQIMRSLESAVAWPFLATQILGNVAVMRKHNLSVINIGSMYSLIAPNPDLYVGRDYINPPGYSIGKSGVLALTRYTAAWLAPWVRANAICPGAIPNTETVTSNSEQNKNPEFMQRLVDRTLLKRAGHPTDLIGALIFLASDASSYMTGQAITIDGGWTIT